MAAVYPFVVSMVAEEIEGKDEKARVLEVGCGPAQYEPHFAARYEGLDIVRHPNARPAVHHLASAESIPTEDARFDVVFGVACFYLMRNISKALAECHRVLRPGASLIIFDYQPHVLKRLAESSPGVHHHVWNASQLRQELIGAGFTATHIRDRSWDLVFPNTPPRRPFLSKVYRPLRRAIIKSFAPPKRTWLIIQAEKS